MSEATYLVIHPSGFRMRYNLVGKLHCETGPAVKLGGYTAYYNNGKLHRNPREGQAVSDALIREWWVEGYLIYRKYPSLDGLLYFDISESEPLKWCL